MNTLEAIVLVLTIVCWLWQGILLIGALMIVAGGRNARFGVLPGILALAGTIYLAVALK